MRWFLKLFCRHQWEKVSDEVLPSPFEQTRREGATHVEAAKISENFFRKCHVVIMKCAKCGEFKRLVTYNPPRWGE